MTNPLAYAPIVATTCAIPQFLPQLRKVYRAPDAASVAGVSWTWAALTSLNNAAWLAYFALQRYWAALVPAAAAVLLSGLLAGMLAARARPARRPVLLVAGWAAVLAATGLALGRAGLGTLLVAAFAVQVTPSLWTAYRTPCPAGISAGTWLLILAELACWLAFGLYRSDPRLIVLGLTGVTASALMLAASRRARSGRPAQHQQGGVVSRVVVADQAPHH